MGGQGEDRPDRTDGRSERYRHRRGELLEAITEHLLDVGLTGFTLRKAAVAVGVSHATLIHHFEGRHELLAEILADVLPRTLKPRFDDDAFLDLGSMLEAAWGRARSPEYLRDTRLFWQFTILSLTGPGEFRDEVASSLAARRTYLVDLLRRCGVGETHLEEFTDMVFTQLRGLQIELMLTGDQARLDRAAAEWIRRTVQVQRLDES